MEEGFAIIRDTSRWNYSQRVEDTERTSHHLALLTMEHTALRPLEGQSILKFEERCPKQDMLVALDQL